MDFSEFTDAQLATVITCQQDTITRATTFRAAPGVGGRGYDNYTRTIEHAQHIIDEYQAELTRRAAAPQEEIAPMETPFTPTEITILAADGAAALALIKPALIKRTSLPVLANVVLDGRDGQLALRLTDLTTVMQTTIPATGEIAITVPYKALVALIGKTGAITIRHTAPERVQVTTSTGTTDLPAISLDDAPRLPAWADWAAQTTIDGAALAHVTKQVAIAASTEETRPVLAGVLWRRTATGSVFAAADGYRLGVLTTADGAGDGYDILPAPVFTALAKLAGPVTLYRNDLRSQVVAVAGDTVVLSRTVDGNFPRYEMIIPTTELIEARVDGVALTAAVKQLGTLAKGNACVLGMRAVGSRLILGATDGEGGTGRVELPLLAPVDGDHVQAVNYTYLLDAIGGHKGPVSVNLAPSPGAPLTITKQADLLMVIMPMHLADRGTSGDDLRAVLMHPELDTETAVTVHGAIAPWEPAPSAPPADDPAPVPAPVPMAQPADDPAPAMAQAPDAPAPARKPRARKVAAPVAPPAPVYTSDPPVLPHVCYVHAGIPMEVERRDEIEGRTTGIRGIVQKPAAQLINGAAVPGWFVLTADQIAWFVAAGDVDLASIAPDTDHLHRAAAAYFAAQTAAAPEPSDPGVGVFLDCPVPPAPEPEPMAYDLPVFMSSRDATIPAPVLAPDTRWDAYPVGAVVRSRSSHLTGTIRRPGLRHGAAGVWLTGGVWLPLADAEIVPETAPAMAPVASIPMAPARPGPVGMSATKPVSKPQDKTPGVVAPVLVNPVVVADAVVAAADALPDGAVVVDGWVITRDSAGYKHYTRQPRPMAQPDPDPAPVARPRRRATYR